MPPAGAGGNRPLLFVVASPSFLVIASPDLSGRGNLARAQDSLKSDYRAPEVEFLPSRQGVMAPSPSSMPRSQPEQ